jgi:alpha-tubulin suppressor-like RCC1 family protein
MLTGPKTGFTIIDTNTGLAQDLGNRYISKDYLIDVYPNLLPNKISPGLWACGYNAQAALGLGNTVSYSSPVQIGSLNNWKQVSCSGSNTAMLKVDGSIWTCGYGLYGRLGVGNASSYSSPVQVGTNTNWRQISSGSVHMGAITQDNTLFVWGGNSAGVLGNGTRTDYNSPIQFSSTSDWKFVHAGNNTIHAIKLNGTLWACGDNSGIAIGNSSSSSYSSPIQIGSLTNWKSISSNSHTLAIKTDNSLWGWGYNPYGEVGASGGYSSPVQIGTLTNWKQVSCGFEHSLAVKQDGTLWGWGRNHIGQLGNNIINTYYASPIQIGSLTNWKQVSCGNGCSVALKTDGTIWGWGSNTSGQLGLPIITVYYSSPVQIGSLTTWKQVSISNQLMAISDGYL